MENPEFWITPLLLLPGVGLLILSTSARYNRLHDEMHHLMHEEKNNFKERSSQLMKRAALFRNSLVGLYVSVAVFSIAGFFGGLSPILKDSSFWLVISFVLVGIICLIYSSVLLIRESIISLDVIQQHCNENE